MDQQKQWTRHDNGIFIQRLHGPMGTDLTVLSSEALNILLPSTENSDALMLDVWPANFLGSETIHGNSFVNL